MRGNVLLHSTLTGNGNSFFFLVRGICNDHFSLEIRGNFEEFRWVDDKNHPFILLDHIYVNLKYCDTYKIFKVCNKESRYLQPTLVGNG